MSKKSGLNQLVHILLENSPTSMEFRKDILEEITPQITNNCSESSNASLKKYYSWSFIPKYKLKVRFFPKKILKKFLKK